MIVVAPLPKKPSSVHCVNNWLNQYNIDMQDVEDACMELQHILKSGNTTTTNNNYITRTGNPLVQDSSFIPLHQAVSQLSVSNTTTGHDQELLLSSARRPRSFSVGQNCCKPVY